MKRICLVINVAWVLVISGTSYAEHPHAKAVVMDGVEDGEVGNVYPDPNQALGAPDGEFVSLGGPGGYIVLDMGNTPIEDDVGPDVEVREIGGVGSGVSEEYRVLISDSLDSSGFIEVGVGAGFSLLDISHTGLTSARYIRLEGVGDTTTSTSTPGADIDSITALHLGSESRPSLGTLGYSVAGAGTRLYWELSTQDDVLGYAIRGSTDGGAF